MSLIRIIATIIASILCAYFIYRTAYKSFKYQPIRYLKFKGTFGLGIAILSLGALFLYDEKNSKELVDRFILIFGAYIGICQFVDYKFAKDKIKKKKR